MTTRKSPKRSLALSFLSLLLCVSMFVGTTFAWFTDSVKSANNIIKSGNLDVDLEYWNGKEWKDVSGSSEILDKNALWEPGYTEVVYLKLTNAGSLALKYQLGVNIISETKGVNKEGEEFKLSDYIYFDVVEDKEPTFTSREEAMKHATETKLISAGYSKAGALEANSEPVYVAMVIYMPTSVGNEANHNGTDVPEINLGINVYATQHAFEPDSFDENYDKNASLTVAPGESIAEAVKNVEDGGIIFLENGVHNLSGGPIVIEGKTVTIVGLGEVIINKNYGGTHIFTIKNGADVTIENVTMDGKNNTREGIYVRWNCVVTLEDVVIKNTGGLDIMIDEASDAAHGENTASYVWLRNSHIEDVAMCASPVTSVAATQDTYVYFNYDANSTVGAIDVQSINKKPENVIINGVASDEVGKTMQLYVANDAELAAALKTIKEDSNYWNKQVIVYLAAGEYSADHVINQYPQWNGIPGRGTGNNYQGGVPAGAPNTVITFVGETVSSYSLRGAQSTPAVTFTGNVTVNGFADSMAGLNSAVAVTNFQSVAFDATNSMEANGEDSVVMYVTAAASNVNFEGCVFTNATHVTLGGASPNGIGNVSFTGCTFDNGGCLSGYPQNLTVTDCVVSAADNGFVNIQSGGDVTVLNSTINAGKYFIRTKSTGTALTVEDSDITMYESEGLKHLVYFRGTNESAKFTDCNIADGYTTAGVDANSTLEIYNYSDVDGLTLVTDGVTDEVTLYLVPSDYTDTTVNVPEGVTSIGNYAFAYNSNVETVVLPSTVRDLGRGFDSSSVKKVVLNEGLEVISSRAFRSTSALEEVVIPSTVVEVADNAFQKSSIKEIVIPASVKTIGETAFGASLIEKVTFEGDIAIQGYAFRGCTKLRTVVMNGNDVTFVKSTLNGRNSMWFCNGESNNPNTSDIDFYVKNAVIKERVLTAMGAERNNTDVYCEDTAGENGVYEDATGNTYAYASDNASLSSAITNGADTVYLSTGSYSLPGASNKEVSISGTKDTVITVNKPNYSGSDVTFNGVTVKGSGYSTGVQHVNTVVYNDVTIIGEMCLYGEKVVFNSCTFELNNQYVWTYGAKEVEFNNCTFNTNGKAILIYNEGAGASNVSVKGCTFNATAGAKAGAIANQNCAAIEIDNFQSSGTGAAHTLVTENNTFGDSFSGEWRIKNFVSGNAVTVNGSEYTQIAVDGKLMTIDANKNVTVIG